MNIRTYSTKRDHATNATGKRLATAFVVNSKPQHCCTSFVWPRSTAIEPNELTAANYFDSNYLKCCVQRSIQLDSPTFNGIVLHLAGALDGEHTAYAEHSSYNPIFGWILFRSGTFRICCWCWWWNPFASRIHTKSIVYFACACTRAPFTVLLKGPYCVSSLRINSFAANEKYDSDSSFSLVFNAHH